MAAEEKKSETPSQKLHKYVFSALSKLFADLGFFSDFSIFFMDCKKPD